MSLFTRPLRLCVASALAATLMAGCGGGGGGGGGGGFPIALGPVSPPPATDPGTTALLPAREALIARARSLELDTPYVPPPGNPLEHKTAGYAKAMCSAVFITGLSPEVAAESVGYFTAPYADRSRVGRPVVDAARREVRIAMPSPGPTLVARHFGSQGCVTLPPDQDDVFFAPQAVPSHLPEPESQPWPMGDVLPTGPMPAGMDMSLLIAATAAAFGQDAYTTSFVATYQGRIIAERYMPGMGIRTPVESWSMGKSVGATLMGILIQQGVYTLDQPAPIPQWQSPGDGRQTIRITDLLRMSSGLRIQAPDDPEFVPNGSYPDHIYYYTGRIDAFDYAATRPQQWPAGQVGRYRNTDPVLINYLIRLAVEGRGEDYLSFPQRALFDKLGIRSMVLETDPYGNFLTQGYDFMSGRDWARLGNLYLQDGVWNGERILPEGFVDYVRTVAPAWAEDKRPIYGGSFWLNRPVNNVTALAAPASAYYMLGAEGQYVVVIPSHDLVVVRTGFSKGAPRATATLNQALTLLLQALPQR